MRRRDLLKALALLPAAPALGAALAQACQRPRGLVCYYGTIGGVRIIESISPLPSYTWQDRHRALMARAAAKHID